MCNWFFFGIFQPNHVVGTQKNCLDETVLLSTKNTCVNWWIRKYRNFTQTIFALVALSLLFLSISYIFNNIQFLLRHWNLQVDIKFIGRNCYWPILLWAEMTRNILPLNNCQRWRINVRCRSADKSANSNWLWGEKSQIDFNKNRYLQADREKF